MTERKEFAAIFLVVSVLLVVLWAILPHDAFFTVDSTVKLVQAQNLLANHYGSVALRYNGQDIDPNLTICPFQLKPSVYVKDGKCYSLFPVLFPFLSSFFYAAMGYTGLYVLPLGSAIACMPLIYAIARRFVPRRTALLAVAAVMLGTPVFFYAQTFWEHTPATLVFLAAVWLLLRCGDSIPQAAASGLLLGVGVWLRSEMLVLAALLYLFGLRTPGKRKAIVTSMLAMAVPLAGLLVFNKLVYGEWFGHVMRNVAALPSQPNEGFMAKLNTRTGWLWTSLLGLNAPQVLSAEKGGWDKTLEVIQANGQLEFFVFCAVAGMAACSLIAANLTEPREDESDGSTGSGRPATAMLPRALAVQAGLLAVLAAAVIRYITTFPQDRSPLITVMKSGGVFTFSPFLAAVLISPLLQLRHRPWGREFKWLLYTTLAFAVVMPLVAPNDGGIRYGARYLLPAIALLAVLAIAVFHAICEGRKRRLFQALLAVLLVLSLVIEARGYQLLYHKKVISRDFGAVLMSSPAERIGATFWWIPFEAPRALMDKKVHIIYNPASTEQFLRGAWAAGETTVNVVVLGKKETIPPIDGAVVVGRREIIQSFDTYFNLTIFTLSLK